MANCKVCEKEFDRAVNDHTTKDHLKDVLSDLIESYKREDYNHGPSEYRRRIEKQIADTEKQIKELDQ